MNIKMTREDLMAFLATAFPQVADEFVVEEVEPMRITVRLPVSDRHLRPGGTVSGPTMFGLADVGVYLAVLSMIGPQALSVTTNCSIDFMRKPEAGKDLIAKVELLKLGRALAVGDVRIVSDGSDAVVSRANLTYSIPPS